MKPAVEEWYLAGFMHRAIRGGDVDEVESLLKQGANPNRVGAGALKGGTPLTWALEYGSDLEIIQVLIKGGADVNRNIATVTPLSCVRKRRKRPSYFSTLVQTPQFKTIMVTTPGTPRK
jgi:ankyrin repeat protein